MMSLFLNTFCYFLMLTSKLQVYPYTKIPKNLPSYNLGLVKKKKKSKREKDVWYLGVVMTLLTGSLLLVNGAFNTLFQKEE